jgi:hypothetical protein
MKRTFSVSQQYFSFTINQPTLILTKTFQTSGQATKLKCDTGGTDAP